MRLRAAACLVAVLAACSSSSGRFGDVPEQARVSGVSGLGGDVEIVYDALGVPHVYAGSDDDAAFALGYAQARDRLFQMDLFRKTATGRLGELLGSNAPRTQDILLRTMFTSRQAAPNGSHHVEDLIAAGLPPDVKAFVQRYADGVNRFVADAAAGKNGAFLPPQYRALTPPMTAAEIAPWTVEDSLAIGRLQSFQLSDTTQDEITGGQLALAAQGGALAPDLYADLARHAQAVPSVILEPASRPKLSAASRGAGAGRAARARAAALRASLEGALAWRASVHLPLADGDRAGSNNWTVAPSRTVNGRTLVANDPHLSLMNPANFHMAHLVTPTRNVAGVIFPGTPAVVIGHNDRIAWGDTVVGYDVTDLYVEQLDSATAPKSTVLDGKPVPLVALTETRKVRGGADDTYPVLLVPHRGPILPGSIGQPGANLALSVRWVGQDPSYEVQAFHELNAAKSVDDAFAALEKFGVGAQNFNIGDADGHIGYYPHAFVPLRQLSATCVPWLPMLGMTSACDWQADASGNPKYIPSDQLPKEKDPSKGYIATANNDVTGALLPPAPGQDANPLLAKPTYLYAYSDVGFREARIQQQLEASVSQTLDTMTALQADNHSLLAETMMPGLLKLLEGQQLSAPAAALVQLWKGWDFSTPTGLDASGGAAAATSSAASTGFHAFLKRFAQQTIAPALTGTGVDPTQLPNEQVTKILVGLTQGVAGASPASTYPLTAPRARWCSDGTCAAAAKAAVEATVGFVAQRLGSADPSAWRWGALHQVLFASPVSPLLSDFGPFPNDGGLFTVDVANFNLWDDRFLQTAGPNVRIATELTPGAVRSRMVIPGGESDRAPILGTGSNPNYMDQVPLWLANAPGDQPFSEDEVRRAAKGKIVVAR